MTDEMKLCPREPTEALLRQIAARCGLSPNTVGDIIEDYLDAALSPAIPTGLEERAKNPRFCVIGETSLAHEGPHCYIWERGTGRYVIGKLSPEVAHKVAIELNALTLPTADPAIREAALREAAWKATGFLVGDPNNGIPLRSPVPHEIAAAILSLIEDKSDD